MKRNVTLVIILFCFLVTVTGCSDAQRETPLTTGLMKGQMAPDFSLKDLGGKQVTLSSFKDNSVVCLVFWATWCPYCVTEIPKLKELHTAMAAKGVKVLAVNVASNDPIQRVKAFQGKRQIPYTILYDENNIASRLYGVQGIPVSIIIDKKGIIQFRDYKLPENIEKVFGRLL